MLIKVATYTNAIEAHLARMRLEVEGIPAFVFHEHHIWAKWLLSLALGGVKVYVHKNNLDHANTIIGAHDRGDYALEDDEKITCVQCQNDKTVKRQLSWKAAMLVVHFTNIPLYFRWATLKCLHCGHEWDLPQTNTYSTLTISLTIFLAVSVFTVLNLVLFLLVGATRT